MSQRMTATKAWAGLAGALAGVLISRLGLAGLGLEDELAVMIETAGVAIVTTAAVYWAPANKAKPQ